MDQVSVGQTSARQISDSASEIGTMQAISMMHICDHKILVNVRKCVTLWSEFIYFTGIQHCAMANSFARIRFRSISGTLNILYPFLLPNIIRHIAPNSDQSIILFFSSRVLVLFAPFFPNSRSQSLSLFL